MRPTFLLLSNDQHRCFITHCLHRRRAPLVRPHCTTDHHGLEVVSTLPRWYYLDDGDHIFFWHFSLSSRLPCESSNWTSSFVSTSQAMFSAIYWRCALFFSWLWWRCLCNFTIMAVLTSWSFYQSPRVCQFIIVHMGQFLQGGKNGRLMSFFFLKLETPFDQTWWDSLVFSILSCFSYVSHAENTLVGPLGPF